jgi:hypothetical protein
MKYIKIKLSYDDALSLGLFICNCGHRPNNHFNFNKERPCVFCDCSQYKERLIMGKLIK